MKNKLRNYNILNFGEGIIYDPTIIYETYLIQYKMRIVSVGKKEIISIM